MNYKGSVCSLYLALQRNPTPRKVSVFNTNRGLYSSYYPARDLPRPLKPLQSVISSLTNYCLSFRLRKLHCSTTIVWYISGTSVHMQPFCFHNSLIFRHDQVIVSSPDPDSQQLRVDYITATWKVGLGNKNDALVPSVPKHWDGCVYT